MAKRESNVDRVYEALRRMAADFAFKPDQRINESALSEVLGASRTPLREALNRLVAEGLLERIETGGCRAARFTLDDINDAIELRGVIEGTAARLAAERGADPVKLKEARYVLESIDGALMQPDNIDFDAYPSTDKCSNYDVK